MPSVFKKCSSQKGGVIIQLTAKSSQQMYQITRKGLHGVLCKGHEQVPEDDFDPEMGTEPEEEEALPEVLDPGM